MADITVERNLVWKEVKDADAYMRCARLFADIHVKTKIWCEHVIIFLSVLSAALYGFECKGVLLSIILTLITAIVEKVLPNFYTDFESVPELRELASFFESHRTKAIEIFRELDSNPNIDAKAAMKEFEKLSECRNVQKVRLDILIKKMPKWLDKKVAEMSDEYLNEIFNYEQ